MRKLNIDKKIVRKYVKERNKRIREDIGILSLSKQNSNPTLWSHYASEHKGFAIGFNMAHAFFEESHYSEYSEFVENNGCFKEDITYDDNWEREAAYDVGFDFSRPDIIFQKSKEWEYESEYRVIKYNVRELSKYGVIGLVDCPPDAISGVYLGLFCSKEQRKIAQAFCQRYSHINCYKAALSKKQYKITFKKL